MSDTPDFAFSSYGWAYRTGSREPNTIIRTHKSTEDSKNARLMLLLPFEPREQQGWTEKARSDRCSLVSIALANSQVTIANIDSDELSVVVGELLYKEYEEDAFPENMHSAKYSALFDPNVHDFVDAASTTGIIVKQMNHDRCHLHPLHSRQDGVYHKHQLPSDSDLKHRIVYYREWTDGSTDTQEKPRKAKFNSGICAFTKKYIEDHQDQSGDTLTTNTWNFPDDVLQPLTSRDTTILYIHLALSLWEDGGETGHLEQVYSVIMECLGRLNWAEVEGTDPMPKVT